MDCGIFMVMMDMPALRRWWCVMLMENFDLGCHHKMFAHWTEMSRALLRGEVQPVFRLKKRKFEDKDVSVENTSKTTVEVDRVKARIVNDCKEAAEWVNANLHLFSDAVELPDILKMGEVELAEAVQQYEKLWGEEEVDEDEKELTLENFKFVFRNPEDMNVFCEEIADSRGYLAYCECRK
ncbi:uncharacterized protein LOC118563986 [Fundulus heteroclitus]|uniref:uncharacterized protein LOC118563986 n=1 Tax=Fundulus heteroclitus TaxID=8078 RepID=UPI00165A98BE|nr:uncharacterized protein LOC118563986 [Fundulus heteroclitus]